MAPPLSDVLGHATTQTKVELGSCFEKHCARVQLQGDTSERFQRLYPLFNGPAQRKIEAERSKINSLAGRVLCCPEIHKGALS